MALVASCWVCCWANTSTSILRARAQKAGHRAGRGLQLNRSCGVPYLRLRCATKRAGHQPALRYAVSGSLFAGSRDPLEGGPDEMQRLASVYFDIPALRSAPKADQFWIVPPMEPA